MEEPNFDELRKKLEKENFPSIYMFKFIVPSDNHKIALVESFFEDVAEINHQPSSNGKYTSITARQVMLSAEAVVNVYRQAAAVEGIISL
jgi:putative lipoic acid-binding regulatory protein